MMVYEAKRADWVVRNVLPEDRKLGNRWGYVFNREDETLTDFVYRVQRDFGLCSIQRSRNSQETFKALGRGQVLRDLYLAKAVKIWDTDKNPAFDNWCSDRVELYFVTRKPKGGGKECLPSMVHDYFDENTVQVFINGVPAELNHIQCFLRNTARRRGGRIVPNDLVAVLRVRKDKKLLLPRGAEALEPLDDK